MPSLIRLGKFLSGSKTSATTSVGGGASTAGEPIGLLLLLTKAS